MKEFQGESGLGKDSRAQLIAQVVALTLATCILIGGFCSYYQVVGDAIAALTLMPILLAALFFGVRGGIISSLLLIPGLSGMATR